MKKSAILFLSAFLTLTFSFAQKSNVDNPTGQSLWLSSPESNLDFEVYDNYLSQMGQIGMNSSLRIEKIWKDQIGMQHARAQQLNEGIPVEGAIILMHGDQNAVTHANGLAVKGNFPSSEPRVTEEKAMEIMEAHYSDFDFYFENPVLEQLIKSQKQDADATFKPIPELVYVDQSFGLDASNYRLAWKLDVFVQKEIDREVLYIDAQTGAVLFVQQACSSGCANHNHQMDTHSNLTKGMAISSGPAIGRGITRYIGEVEITTDSIADSTFILNDVTRGQGVRTYDANNNTDPSLADDFYDDDNFWDMRNPQRNEAAIDAHHGAQMTYDFWFENYNWSSYDGNGSPMLCYVHWDQGWFNASWNGMFSRYGDGVGDPLTYIDIVAHEFAHGLTGTTAGLIYSYESGAVNESFSDIFGTAVEHFALGQDFQWFIGIPNDPFRNMSNPNQFGHPDTYLGDNWHTASSDNGGVHINSGVQNFWYYLLVNGGAGINDFGHNYQVDSLGWDKASAIAFRNLTTYLTPSSQYYDARLGSLQAAADLYGECSPEVEAVAQAWAAVGLGSDTPTRDLQVLASKEVLSSCNLSDDETVGISFRYNPSGCGFSLDSGSVIKVGYQIDGQTVVEEEILLDQTITEGNIFNYEFEQGADVSEPGNYNFSYWINYSGDDFSGNDTLINQMVSKPVQFENDRKVTFRNFTSTRDSFYLDFRENAEVELFVSGSNPSPGLLALSMTGLNATPNNIDFPTSEEDNFVLNPDFESKICFCVDLTDWNNFNLSFDLRQTFSNVYLLLTGIDVPQFVSSLRVTVDGQQVGEQFHPETYEQDPWETHTMDLTDFVGAPVELCFEGKHFLDRQTDRDAGGTTRGDYSYLDNITFSGAPMVSNNDLNVFPVEITPNPSTDMVNVRANISGSIDVQFHVMDVSGRRVFEVDKKVDGDFLNQEIDVSRWKAGIYTLIIQTNTSKTIKKLVVQK